MAKNDNLTHYLSDLANAIREKEGSTDPINAQDFSEKIRSMSIGSDPGFLDYYYVRTGDIFAMGQTVPVSAIAAIVHDTYLQNVWAVPSTGFIKFESTEEPIFPVSAMTMGSGLDNTSYTALAIPKYFFIDLEKIANGEVSCSFPNRTSLNDVISMLFGVSFNMEEAAKDLFITSEEFWNA